MKPHVLIIGGWNEVLQPIAKMDMTITLIQSPGRLTLAQAQYANTTIILEIKDTEVVVENALRLHQNQLIDMVLSFTQDGLDAAHRVAETLNIPTNCGKATPITRNKFLLRKRLAENGFINPMYLICENEEDATAFFEKNKMAPFMLKPILGSGKDGVHIIRDEQDVHRCFNKARTNHYLPLLAEEFVEGKEYSVEAFSQSGRHSIISVTEKINSGAPHFVEIGHQLPARLSGTLTTDIEKYMCHFLNVVQHENGPTHTEIILSKDGPIIVDSHTRVGGCKIWEMVERATGFNFFSSTVLALLRQTVLTDSTVHQAGAIRFFAYEKCKIVSVEGVSKAVELPHIERVICSLNPGDRLGTLDSNDKRQGYILAVANDTNRAVSAVEAAMGAVQIRSVECLS